MLAGMQPLQNAILLYMDTEQQTKQTDILDLTGVETLTSTQLNFINLVLCGSSISAAALASGISRRTGTTWMQPGADRAPI